MTPARRLSTASLFRCRGATLHLGNAPRGSRPGWKEWPALKPAQGRGHAPGNPAAAGRAI